MGYISPYKSKEVILKSLENRSSYLCTVSSLPAVLSKRYYYQESTGCIFFVLNPSVSGPSLKMSTSSRHDYVTANSEDSSSSDTFVALRDCYETRSRTSTDRTPTKSPYSTRSRARSADMSSKTCSPVPATTTASPARSNRTRSADQTKTSHPATNTRSRTGSSKTCSPVPATTTVSPARSKRSRSADQTKTSHPATNTRSRTRSANQATICPPASTRGEKKKTAPSKGPQQAKPSSRKRKQGERDIPLLARGTAKTVKQEPVDDIFRALGIWDAPMDLSVPMDVQQIKNEPDHHESDLHGRYDNCDHFDMFDDDHNPQCSSPESDDSHGLSTLQDESDSQYGVQSAAAGIRPESDDSHGLSTLQDESDSQYGVQSAARSVAKRNQRRVLPPSQFLPNPSPGPEAAPQMKTRRRDKFIPVLHLHGISLSNLHLSPCMLHLHQISIKMTIFSMHATEN